MNFTEQKNYIIAVFVSLIIHCSLLTIYLPDISAPEEPAPETIQVGLVEISAANKIRRISVALNAPGKGQPNIVTAPGPPVEKLENQSGSRENPDPKSVEKPAQPANDTTADTTALPEADKVVASDTTAQNAAHPSAPGEDAEGTAGSADSTTNGPQSFGTGEAMVKIVGPMPSYPPAALKAGKEGEATLRILVNAAGQLDLVIVTKSSGDIRLDYAATSSIERKWKFTSINEGYYIDLTFSFDIQIGVSVKFLTSKTRS